MITSSDFLVTVYVLSYNSSKTIIETLDSIREQTYKNIELIVTDDCSSDNTVTLVKQWLVKNKKFFVDARLIEASINTGVAENSNRAIRDANGKWLKVIAGDDMLLPDCVEINVKYVEEHPEVKVLFSHTIKRYIRKDKDLVYKPEGADLRFYSLSSEQQYLELLKHKIVVLAPTSFIEAKLLKEMPYDIRYRNIEDLPKWVDFTSKGIKLYYMDKPTVLYRIDDNMSSGSSRYFYSRTMWESYIPFFYEVMRPAMTKNQLLQNIKEKENDIMRYLFAVNVLGNNRTLINSIRLKLFTWFYKRH